MGALPLALQLYTVREPMEADLEGTLASVKKAGYDYVELAGLHNRSAAEFRGLLQRHGLKPISAHYGYADVTERTAQVLEDATTLGIRHVVVSWLGGDLTPDEAAWRRCAQEMGRAGEDLAAAGVQLSYHNHDHEFAPVDHVAPFDLIFETAPAVALKAEIDVYWVRAGGRDPAVVIEAFAGRCPLLHVKDCRPDAEPPFAEVGHGVIDWGPVLEAGVKSGAEWFIVEQDLSARDPLESIRMSAEFMKRQRV
jgi:sugar phosphate isomerase/epimerase